MNPTLKNDPNPKHKTFKRLLTWGIRAVGGLFALILVLGLGLMVILHTDWGREQAKHMALMQVNALFNGAELRVERLDGTFIKDLALYNIDLIKTSGERLAHIDTLTAAYRLLPLLQNRLHLIDIRVVNPQIQITQQADDTWDLFNTIVADSTQQEPLALKIDRFRVNGGNLRAVFHAQEQDSILWVRNLNIILSAVRLDKTLMTMQLDTLYTQIIPPYGGDPIQLATGGVIDDDGFTLNDLSLESSHSHVTGQGHFALPWQTLSSRPDLAFRLQAHPLSFRDLSLFLPGLDPNGSAQIDIDLQGPTLEQVSGHATALLVDTRYDAYALDRTTLASTFTNGVAHIDLTTGLDGNPIILSADLRPSNDEGLIFDAHINLGQGLISARGTASFTDAIRYQVNAGAFNKLDMATLVGDTTASALNGTFSLTGRGTDPTAINIQADLQLQPSFYGHYRLTDAAFQLNLSSGLMQVNGNANLDQSGAFSLSATARPFDDVFTIDVSPLAFRHVDLGVPEHGTVPHNDLNGTLTLSARGTEPKNMTANVRLDLTPSRVNEQPIQSAHLSAQLRDGNFSYDAHLDLVAGRVAGKGTMRPFDNTPSYNLREGTFQGIDLGLLTGIAGFQTDLNGSLALSGTGLDLETLTLATQLNLIRSTVEGTPLHESQVTAHIEQGQAQIDFGLRTDTGRLSGQAIGDFTTPEPRYEVVGVIEDLELNSAFSTDTLTTRLSLNYDLRGEGLAPSTMALQGHLLASGDYGPIRLDKLATAFRLAGGIVLVDSLVLHANLATATAGGSIALFDTTGNHVSDFRFDADITDLEPLRPLIRADFLSLSQGEVHATLQGPANELRAQITATAHSLVYNSVRLAGLTVNLKSQHEPGTNLPGVVMHADLDYLEVNNVLVTRTSLDATYDGKEIALTARVALDPRRDAQISARLNLSSQKEQIQIENLNMRFDEDLWALREPTTLTYGDAYGVSNFELVSGNQRIWANGVIDPRGEQDFHATVDSLRVGALADLIGFQALDGILSSTLDLTGTAPTPQMKGHLSFNIISHTQPAGDLRLDLSHADHKMGLKILLTHTQGSTLNIEGTLPLNLSLTPADTTTTTSPLVGQAEGDVNLKVTGNAFDIDWFRPFLNPQNLSHLRGDLSTDITVSGTMNAPTLDGTFLLTKGRAKLPLIGITYRNIGIDAKLAHDGIVIHRAELHTGNGSLIATGRIEMTRLTLGQYTIDMALDKFSAIHSSTYEAALSGHLQLSGTTQAPIVAGDLRVLGANLFLTDTAGEDIEQVALTKEDIRMLEEQFGYRISQQDTTTSNIYDALKMDVNLEVERDTWIRQSSNPEMAIQMMGRLELHKMPDEEIQLFRSIEMIPSRSYIRQFGRRFDIVHGRITFDGPVAEMIMDVGAEFEVRSHGNPGQPEAIINLTLSGPIDDLKLALGSEPQMSNTDIVSYIATGKPASEALRFGGDDQGGFLSQGGALAASELANIVEGVAAEGLGLDVIEIQQDGLKGTRIVAGKYVSPRLYLGVSQPIALSSTVGTGSAPTGTQPTEVTVEYELFDWLLLRLLSGTSGSSMHFNLAGRYAF